MEIKKDLEILIGLIENNMQEEGYITKRYSQTSGKFGTTSYDCLILRGENGKEYTIDINERMRLNRETGNIEATNDLANELNNAMKFFEFSGVDFGYYALIGAFSEEEAIKNYEEIVGEIDDKEITPLEISKDEAKKKLISICNSSKEANSAKREFNKCTLGTEPYLILIDGSLL